MAVVPWIAFALISFALSACGSQSTSMDMLTGVVTRDEIETREPAWRDELAAASIDDASARALNEVPPGAEVVVFLGTWCGDSRRVLSRLLVALERAPTAPFSVRMVAVDRSKHDPDGLTDGQDIRYVPTIIVRRDGAEVGRIVESAPHGVEVDLLALLRGEASGVLSLRTDL